MPCLPAISGEMVKLDEGGSRDVFLPWRGEGTSKLLRENLMSAFRWQFILFLIFGRKFFADLTPSDVKALDHSKNSRMKTPLAYWEWVMITPSWNTAWVLPSSETSCRPMRLGMSHGLHQIPNVIECWNLRHGNSRDRINERLCMEKTMWRNWEGALWFLAHFQKGFYLVLDGCRSGGVVNMVGRVGVEPTARWLRVSCSTNWANGPTEMQKVVRKVYYG